MTFEYSVEKDTVPVISLKGDLMDKNQAAGLLAEIDEMIASGTHTFIISLEELRHLNSSGLNVLISVLTKARKAGGEVAIANLSSKVKELFLITKLNSVFSVATSVEEAKDLIKA